MYPGQQGSVPWGTQGVPQGTLPCYPGYTVRVPHSMHAPLTPAPLQRCRTARTAVPGARDCGGLVIIRPSRPSTAASGGARPLLGAAPSSSRTGPYGPVRSSSVAASVGHHLWRLRAEQAQPFATNRCGLKRRPLNMCQIKGWALARAQPLPRHMFATSDFSLRSLLIK